MAIDLNQLTAKIRARLSRDEEDDLQPTQFKVVSETNSSPLLSSVRSALGKNNVGQPQGLVRTVLSKAPSVIAQKTKDYLAAEAEFDRTHTIGEQAVRDLIEKPAKILKAVSVDLPRAVLGGLSSVGKTALEAVYTPVFGKEQVRKALEGDEQDKKIESIIYGSPTKSWQAIKEDIDAYVQKSPESTDWEKKNLGLTLAVAGFVGDAWVGGGGKAKTKIAEELLEQLVKEGDEAAVKTILTKTKMPAELVEAAASRVAQASTKAEVKKAVEEAAQGIFRQVDDVAEAGAKEALETGTERSAASKTIGLMDDHETYTPNMKALIKEAQDTGATFPYTKFSKEEQAIVDAAFKDTISKVPVKVPKDFKPYEATITSETLDVKKLNDPAYFKQVYESAFAVGGDKKLYNTLTKELVPKDREASSFLADLYQKAKSKAPAPKTIPTTPVPPRAAAAETRRAPRGFTKEEAPMVAEVDASDTFKGTPPVGGKPTAAAISAYRDDRSKFGKLKDAFIEQVQDEMVRVRRIVNDKRIKVTDASNPYDAEIAFHGRVGTRLEDLKERAGSLDKDIFKTANKAGVKSDTLSKEVNEYLIARHAPERNAALGDGAAGIKTADAAARMAELEKLPYFKELKRIADEIQKINNTTLDILKEGEVITDELYDTLRKKYKNHIPLYRVMENEEDFAGALGKAFDVKGTGIKTAKGSDKEVMDVLGNVVYNNEQALIRSEKNRVDLATLKLVRDNKEAFGDMFKVRRPKVVGKTFSGKPIMEVVTDPQSLVLREKGKPVIIEIKDPQLAMALRGVGRDKLSGMMRGIAAISRFYSGVNTRFNPEFAFSNKIRDIQEVLVYAGAQGELGGKGVLGMTGRELRLENEKAVLDFMRGKDSEGARLYKQMRDDGGTTGGMGLSTRKQVEVDLTQLRKLNRSKPRQAAQKTIELIDRWNQIFEDSSRLSVYREAIKNGASRQRAAVLAKEASVNFNKFGRQGSIINALYIFANASIQGTTKTIRAMKNPKVAAVVGTAVFGSVYALNEWNDSVDPDWRNKITTYDRLNSMPVMIPTAEGEGVRYITIPVAWGIKPIKVMADELYDLAAGKSEGALDAANSVLTAALEAYNPVGGSDVISSVTPTILDIPLDVARNQSWSGAAIRPDWDRNAPASIQYFPSLRDSSTGRIAVGISKGLSGIGIEVSPADLKYAYDQLIGGAGRAADKTVNTITSLGGGEIPEAKDIPFVSRFYKTRPDEEVGAGAKEFETIANILSEQSRERFYLNQQAEDAYQQMKNLPKEEAARRFNELKEADPELAKEVASVAKEDKKGLTFIDRKILQLGVANGERAKFLYTKFSELDSNEDKKNLWNEYKAKGILSKEVEKQLRYLLKNNGSTE